MRFLFACLFLIIICTLEKCKQKEYINHDQARWQQELKSGKISELDYVYLVFGEQELKIKPKSKSKSK